MSIIKFVVYEKENRMNVGPECLDHESTMLVRVLYKLD